MSISLVNYTLDPLNHKGLAIVAKLRVTPDIVSRLERYLTAEGRYSLPIQSDLAGEMTYPVLSKLTDRVLQKNPQLSIEPEWEVSSPNGRTLSAQLAPNGILTLQFLAGDSMNAESEWRYAKAVARVANAYAKRQKYASDKYDILFRLLGGSRDVYRAQEVLEKQDTQSDTLFNQVLDKLADALTLTSNQETALSRVLQIVQNAHRWDIGLLRNNVFKAADSLGIRLPSFMFANQAQTDHDYDLLMTLIGGEGQLIRAKRNLKEIHPELLDVLDLVIRKIAPNLAHVPYRGYPVSVDTDIRANMRLYVPGGIQSGIALLKGFLQIASVPEQHHESTNLPGRLRHIAETVGLRAAGAQLATETLRLHRNARDVTWYDRPSPADGMGQYIEALKGSFLMPYPAIWNSLGVDRNAVHTKTTVQGDRGILEFSAPDTHIVVEVSANGTLEVSGHVKDVRLNRKFQHRPAASGIHRGVQGDISTYIESQLPVQAVYQVVGDTGETFDSVEQLTRKYRQTGTYSGPARKELQGQPVLEGLVGPMYNGRKGDVVTIRYETSKAYDHYSKGASDKEAWGRAPLPRESYLPAELRGTDPWVPHGTDLFIWKYERSGKLLAIAFSGRSQKPLWHFSFPSESARESRIQRTIQDNLAAQKAKQDKRDERQNFEHGLAVGDILYSSWGYDQTNVDFYQVVAVSGKAVAIRETEKREVGSSKVIPIKGKFVGPVLKKIPSKGYKGTPSIRLNSYSSASLWDGQPKYVTPWGEGH